ncbi:hypothetical protein [Limnoglobus roseus]|uniref:TIGR03009 domain-containing protein n=1 Tax=Limnoglobus roseus TaxID=2598579 RepID=A0A5C1AC75_9BACT|nr:hypothetical protein [Limnoglobus roseus]QEL16881.1 hypothetical protein PX52LOC_03856 [Limnoglobus roseus]
MSITAARPGTNRTARLFLGLGLFACVSVAALGQEPPQPTTQSPSGQTPTTPATAEPLAGASKYQIDKRLAMFQKIRDDAIFPWTDSGPRHLEDGPADQMEERAYDEVLRHARQFTTAELEEHARHDVTPRDLYTNGRLSYKLDLIYFEGTVRRVRKVPSTELLQASGITDVYEAWMFPDRTEEAVCIFVTELPPGMTVPTDLKYSVNYRASIAGYYFKLLRYESGEIDRTAAEVGQHKTRRAPVLMGRSLTLRDEGPTAGAIWRESVMPLVVGGVAMVAFTIFGLSWYFRRGDAVVRREIEKKLSDNPFSNG